MLVVVSGLPATGKTTVSREVAHSLGAVHLRIDVIEQGIMRAGAPAAARGPLGYGVGYALAEDLLRQRFQVWAESVNPVAITREAWRAVAANSGVECVEVEFICSDPLEHKRRARSRTTDIPDLGLPGGEQIQQREYEPWDRNHIVLDTAGKSVPECVKFLYAALRSRPQQNTSQR